MKKESMVVRIGLDDTDHPDSGCTTYSYDSLLKELSKIEGVNVRE